MNTGLDILHSLSTTAAMSQMALADDLGVSRVTVGRWVTRLESDLAVDVDRRRGPGSAKRHVIRITGRGRALLARRSKPNQFPRTT